MSAVATQYSHFDMNHWLAVSAERRRQGMARHPERGQLQPDHPLVGKTLVDTATNRTYVVESVRKDWLQGWYMTAMLNCEGSHRVVIVQAQPWTCPTILSQLQVFEGTFKEQQLAH